MRSTTKLILVLALTIIFSSFQNCGGAKFDFDSAQPATSSNVPEGPVPPPEVATACASTRVIETETSITFPSNWENPATDHVCKWDRAVNGDYIVRDGSIMSRNEEVKTFAVPSGHVLCGLEMLTPSQTISYDDIFFLNFNGIVLVSSAEFFHGFEQSEGMTFYDWTKLVNVPHPPNFNQEEYAYCLGKTEGLSTCNIPVSQQTGQFRANINDRYIQTAGLRAANNVHELRLVVTGDNDASLDCRHKALSLKVKLKYAPL